MIKIFLSFKSFDHFCNICLADEALAKLGVKTGDVLIVKDKLFWQIPLLFALFFFPLAGWFDNQVASFFAGDEGQFGDPLWCSLVYKHAPLFGQALFIVSTSLVGYGLAKKRFSLWFPSLYICLTLLLSGGVIGHLLCKRHWTRPRPYQTIQFGGKYPYSHPLCRYKGPIEKRLKSMPSSHATWGFYFITLFFVGANLKRRPLMLAGIGLALFLGCLLSVGRLVQGGHYLSDVVASALIMWLTAYGLDRWFASLQKRLMPENP